MTDIGRRREVRSVGKISLAKWLLCLLNFVLLVVGFAVLCFAIWAAWDKHSFIEFTGLIEDEELRTQLAKKANSTIVNRTIYIIIGAMGFMMFGNAVGYIGALRESRRLLTSYALILLIILLLELFAGWLAAAYAYNAERDIKAAANASFQQYQLNPFKKEKTAETLLWDSFFTTFQCCGFNGYEDFRKPDKFHIPETCCAFNFTITGRSWECLKDPENSKNMKLRYEVGCYDVILGLIKKNIKNYTIIAIGIISGLPSSASLGIILASCMCDSILKRKLTYTCRRKRKWLLTEYFEY
jgi:hypothetical protein